MAKFLNSDGLTRLVALIKQSLGGKQDTLTFDSTPTASSTNPVTSGGVKTALDTKQDTLVSGTSIKTINSTSILGSGDIDTMEFYTIPLADVSTLLLAALYNVVQNQTSLNTACENILTALKGGKKITFNYSDGADVTNFVSTREEYYDNGNSENKWIKLVFDWDTTNKVELHLTKNSSTSNWSASLTGQELKLTVNGSGDVVTGLNTLDGQYALDTENLKTINSTSILGDGDILVQPTLVSGTNIKTINNTSLLGSGNISVQAPLTFDSTPTTSSTNPVTSGGIKTAVDNYCPIIEDTRSSQVATITGVAPFASLVGGQKIILHLAQASVANTALQLTLSNDSTTSAIPVYAQTQYSVSQVGLSALRAGGYYELVYNDSNNRWNIIGKDLDTNLDKITTSLIETGTDTNAKAVSAKVLRDNFYTEGEVDTLLNSKQATLTFDSTPTDSSSNPVTSGGIKTALDDKQDTTSNLVVNEDPVEVEEVDNIELLNSIDSIDTTESQESGGDNTVTITETNGTVTTFVVKNGIDGTNGVSLGDVGIADNLTTNDATKVLSAKQGYELGRKLNYDAPVYDKADFDNIFRLVGDIGVHAYLKPNNTTTLVLSEAYRYFWVKASKGDTIYTWTKGYSDVVTLGFSASRKLDSNFVVIDNTGDTKQRSATASADGYFYVGVQYSSSGTPLENRVWVIPQPDIYKEYTLDASTLTVDHLLLVTNTTGTGKIATISYASNTMDSITLKVRRGDKVHARAKNYTDSAVIFFTREVPETGGSAVSLVSGTGSVEDNEAIAPSDGYITISYVRSAYISGLKIETPYAFREVDSMKSKIDSIETEVTDFSQGIIKDWDVLKSNSVVRGERNSQVSYLFPVEKGFVVKVKGAQYTDTALLSFSETMPSVGGTVEIAFVGAANSAMPLREYVAPKDGYVMATLRKDVSQTGSMISITKVDYDAIPIPHIAFESLQAEASSEMSANDVISNIYEPLRQAHPEYIKRKSLGKDASNTYDIWLYEFDNSVDEWFSQDNDISYYGSNLVDTTGLDANQFRIAKSDFDSDLATLTYKNLYVDGVCDMRKPVLVDVANKVEETVDGTVYYKFTADEDVKVYTNTQSVKGITVTWTKENKTYDQHVMLVSGVHGTEPTGFMGTALALKYLVEHHDNNKTLDYIYNHVKLSVIPVVNVWGTNQSPKVRTNSNNKNLNDYTNSPLTAEQQIVVDYVASIKDELSCFLDLHTSEANMNYGMVYAMTTKNSKLTPALTAVSGYLCKHWFPTMPPYNWNIGTISASIGSNYMKWNYDVEAATVEFCGWDLRVHGSCDKWSSKYMTYAVENYVNYIIAACALRLKNNTVNIISEPFFGHSVMG